MKIFDTPPEGIILDYFDYKETDSTENNISEEGVLHKGDCMKHNKYILLFDAMPGGNYRVRVLYHYPFDSDCGISRSNWFYYEIDNTNIKY